MGQDVAGAGVQGGDRVPGAGWADRVPGGAALPPGGLRLHDLHRQLGAAAPGDLGGGGRGGPGGLLGAVRQPQLRGADQPGREDELPGLAAAVRRLRAGRDHGRRPLLRPAGDGLGRRAGVPARPLALSGRGQRADRGGGAVGHVPLLLRRGVRGRRALERAGGADRGPLRLGRGLHVRPPAAVLRRHGPRARAGPAPSPTSACATCCAATPPSPRAA